MSVFSNVITPQGLEPLQFPTKFRSHSGPGETGGTYEHLGTDIITSVREETIGYEGMKCTSSDQTGQFGAVS